MPFIVGWDGRASNVERTACAIDGLVGAVGHRCDSVGIALCNRRISLIQVLLRTGREDAPHFLPHLLHLGAVLRHPLDASAPVREFRSRIRLQLTCFQEEALCVSLLL